MIVDLPSTTTTAVSRRLIRLREDVGAMALGRVLTLVIVIDEKNVDRAIEVANAASRQHPCRVVTVVAANKRGKVRLDAQIRVGGDAGASEVVVFRLYGALADQGLSVVTPLLLPDSPIVVWWPRAAPKDAAADPIGAIAQRRVTDSAFATNPVKSLVVRADTYSPGDTDLAWTRITNWRAVLAAALDQPPYESVTAATVTGASDSPSADLLAGWLAAALKCRVSIRRSPAGTGLRSVQLVRASGAIDLIRPAGGSATLAQPGQPDRRIVMPPRSDEECLADELRRLDPDEVYAEALRRGLPKISGRGPRVSAASGPRPSAPTKPTPTKATAKTATAKKATPRKASS